MQIGDLVKTRSFPMEKVGVIIAMSKPVPNEALVLWNDGVRGYIAVWALEALCK
jgi:hypothetical protein